MRGLRKLLPWLALVILAGLIGYFALIRENRGEASKHAAAPRSSGSMANETPEPRESAKRPREDREDSLLRLIESNLAKFRNSSDREESRRILDQLRASLRGADPTVAARAIAAFLKTGADAPTKLPFSVGPEGVMDGVPSLRTALLDLLPSLDPELALEISRAIMDQKTTPDEYALALRNLAWNDLNGDLQGELIDRLNRMIQVSDWLSQPSAGFLEAVDAAVFASGEQSFDLIASLGRGALVSGDQDLARAAFIAMDRMVQQDPGLLIQAYDRGSGLAELGSNQRASLMSRLEISDPGQRELFVRYLGDPGVGEEELAYFAKIFPNGNYIHGNWLMSGTAPTRSLAERRDADLQVLSELDRLKARLGSERMIQAIDQIADRLKRQTHE